MADDPIFSTEGQADRMARAAESLVWVLGGDPRVQSAYAAWRMAHGLHGTFADLDTFKRALLTDRDRDRDLMQRLVRDDLHLSYTWLPDLLLYDFGATVVAEITGASLGVLLELTPGMLPPSRKPKGGGEYILRDVEWFYRVEVKRPADTIESIGREYVATNGIVLSANTRPRDAVKKAIARAKGLLNALDLNGAQ